MHGLPQRTGLGAVDRLLRAPDKGASLASGIDGILANLFRQMLQDRQVDTARWRYLMDRYIERVCDVGMGARARSGLRGNTMKAFCHVNMTMRTFCRALQFLEVEQFQFRVDVIFEDHKQSQHSTGILDFISETIPEEEPERSGTNLERILLPEDKGVSLAQGIDHILSNIFRQLLVKRGVDAARWRYLLDRYVIRAGRQHESTKSRSGLKGNATKAFYRDVMTMRTFCRALQFMEIQQFRPTVEICFHNGDLRTFTTQQLEFDRTLIPDVEDEQ